MVATREARYPSGIDFACGFQSLCPSGTRCRASAGAGSFAFQLSEKEIGQLHSGLSRIRLTLAESTAENRNSDLGQYQSSICGTIQAMLQTSARLLRLLSLFQAQRYWSGADSQQRLDVTGRTLRRDVDRLRSLGYPVHSTSGVAGGYQLGAGANLPPLLLDDDEAVAVALGLRTSASGGISGIEEASVRALLKLEQVLPPRLRHRVAALHGFFVPLETPRSNASMPNSLSVIAGACRDYEGIRFKYQRPQRVPSARAVEPHRLVHTGYRWYLVAWDIGRNDWRTFRVDRIEGKPKTSTRFQPAQAAGRRFCHVCFQVSVAGAVSCSILV